MGISVNDILGRTTAIFTAVILFFGIPLVAMEERMKGAAQMYLLAEETDFIDSICNTGFLNLEMYEELMWDVAKVPGRYEVELLQERKELVLENGEVAYVSRYYDTEEILEEIRDGKDYYFFRNDYIRICIIQKEAGICLPGISDKTMQVFYGGTVKYETF